jgi:hypothetical protein
VSWIYSIEIIHQASYKMHWQKSLTTRNEIYQNEMKRETKRNVAKFTKAKRNETYQNLPERNETKWNVHKNWKGIENYIKYIRIASFCSKPSAWLFASFCIEIEKKKKSSSVHRQKEPPTTPPTRTTINMTNGHPDRAWNRHVC